MLIKVQLCYDRRVGLGVKAATKIPKDTIVLYYYGDVHSTAQVKKDDGMTYTHLMTIPGTGCSINGEYKILFPSEPVADLNKTHTIPCPLMSLTNSSYEYKNANCKLIIKNKPTLYANNLSLDQLACLATTRDIEEHEELIWNYSFR